GFDIACYVNTGVFNGVITAKCSIDNIVYMVTAQLPPYYYDTKKTVVESDDVHTLEERIKELEHQLEKCKSTIEEQNEHIQALQTGNDKLCQALAE
ncbi:hypothetical protein PMAYCL1PPCAC_09300, partial [Pristionchus mayeri]